MTRAVLRIFESELLGLVRETDAHRSIETGGSLYGLWTDGGNATVFLATGPGPLAKRHVAHFEQDVDAHAALERLLVDQHGVQAVGLWHSHHGLGLPELSRGDLERTMRFARRSDRRRFCDVLTYLGPDGADATGPVVVKPYLYSDAAHGVRPDTEVVVLPGTSPVRHALMADSVGRHLVGDDHRWGAPVRFEIAGSSARGTDAPARRGRSIRGWLGIGGSQTERQDGDGESPATEHAIADLAGYVERHLGPSLRSVPHGVTCEVEPIADGALLRLVLADRDDEHVLDLGAHQGKPVVVGHWFRVRGDTELRDALSPGDRRAGVDLADRVGHVLATFGGQSGRR